MQTIFTVLIVVQFLVVALHDLVDIPGWTHGRQVQSALGRNKVLIGTLINSLFPGLAAAFALYYWRRPLPAFVLNSCVVSNQPDPGRGPVVWNCLSSRVLATPPGVRARRARRPRYAGPHPAARRSRRLIARMSTRARRR